jgi:hypothetical protein
MNNIPKKVYLYWDRPTPMSWLQTMTIDTFIKHNPDWSVNVYVPKQAYTGKPTYIPDYTGKDFFGRVENNSLVNIIEVDLKDYCIDIGLHNILRSDILRYRLLYDNGGVWSDFDVVWLKPISYLSTIVGHNNFNATMCVFEKGTKHHNISILVSSQGHPFYKVIIDKCCCIQDSCKVVPDHQEYGTKMWNDLFPDMDKLLESYSDMAKLEYYTFFPYSIFDMDRLYNKIDLSVITDKVMCVHWFNGHTLSKKYVNENNFNKKCSMSELIKLIGGYNV